METGKVRISKENNQKLADKIDGFEKYSTPHSQLIHELSTRLAVRLGLGAKDVEAISEAALLHDIGLYAMAPPYYASPRPLKLQERIDVWRHPVIGEQHAAKRGSTRHAQLLIRWHHEWWNGTGYPDMLAFDQIPVGARILRAVELYSALISRRPYRAALAENDAIEVLKLSAGIECDPYVVRTLLAIREELTPIPTTASEHGADQIQIDRAEQIDAPAAITDALQPPDIPKPPVQQFASADPGMPQGAAVFPVVEESRVRNWLEIALAGETAPHSGSDQQDESRGWSAARNITESLLGFEASVVRQIEFKSIAIPYCGWARLEWYLKGWGKQVFSNDPRAWASAASKAVIEATEPLNEELVRRLVEDAYVPGNRLMNPALSEWFGESDAWWLDNMKRNIDLIEDEKLRAQAVVLAIHTGDYALSFNDETRELKQSLTSVFLRLAGRIIETPLPQGRGATSSVNAVAFIRQARADLFYMNIPPSAALTGEKDVRSAWREAWVRGSKTAATDELLSLAGKVQSKTTYMEVLGRLLRAAAHIRTWAIGCQELGLASAREISEMIKQYRPVRAVYSKDVTEVPGGSRNYILLAEKK